MNDRSVMAEAAKPTVVAAAQYSEAQTEIQQAVVTGKGDVPASPLHALAVRALPTDGVQPLTGCGEAGQRRRGRNLGLAQQGRKGGEGRLPRGGSRRRGCSMQRAWWIGSAGSGWDSGGGGGGGGA